MINWRRRLFRQHDPGAPAVHARDVGFTGRAGEIVIDDQYRLADIRSAVTAKQRAGASEGWLRKIARNAERGYDEIGDPAILAAVDKAFEAVASAIIFATDELKNDLRGISGMEDFEDRFARRRRPDVTMTELPQFILPERRDPGPCDNDPARDWEMERWLQLRLGLTPAPGDLEA